MDLKNKNVKEKLIADAKNAELPVRNGKQIISMFRVQPPFAQKGTHVMWDEDGTQIVEDAE